MSTLGQAELRERIDAGGLIRSPRRTKGGAVDLQPASYDLTAGRAVWSEPSGPKGKERQRHEVTYDPEKSLDRQPFVVLRPGQMMSIISHEDILVPPDLCATVYSKNNLALNGIFAFNSGHVDPGYEGPIVIRLINLRATSYTITLGQPIFTIVFHRLALSSPGAEELPRRPAISAEQMLRRVREFADVALSNALFDLYADRIDERLSDHRTDMLLRLRTDLGDEFVRQDELGRAIWKWGWAKALVILGVISLVLTIVRNITALLSIGQ